MFIVNRKCEIVLHFKECLLMEKIMAHLLREQTNKINSKKCFKLDSSFPSPILPHYSPLRLKQLLASLYHQESNYQNK